MQIRGWSRKRGPLHFELCEWKKQLKENARAAFDQPGGRNVEKVQDDLLRKIGELTVERDFLARGLRHSR